MKTFLTIVLVIIFILALVYIIFDHKSFTFTADIDGSTFDGNRAKVIYTSGRLKISAFHAAADSPLVVIDLNATKTGTYLLNDDNSATGNVAVYFAKKNVFASNSRFTGSVTITKFDLEEKEVSGTFAFQGVQVVPPGLKVVNVTNGEFENLPIGNRK
ncbi:MAG: DUF6252 family protein [Bacteroidota bacterium]|jgi:hypothetical protein